MNHWSSSVVLARKWRHEHLTVTYTFYSLTAIGFCFRAYFILRIFVRLEIVFSVLRNFAKRLSSTFWIRSLVDANAHRDDIIVYSIANTATSFESQINWPAPFLLITHSNYISWYSSNYSMHINNGQIGALCKTHTSFVRYLLVKLFFYNLRFSRYFSIEIPGRFVSSFRFVRPFARYSSPKIVPLQIIQHKQKITNNPTNKLFLTDHMHILNRTSFITHTNVNNWWICNFSLSIFKNIFFLGGEFRVCLQVVTKKHRPQMTSHSHNDSYAMP